MEVIREGTLEEAVEAHREGSGVDLLGCVEEVLEALEVRVRRTVSLVVLAVREKRYISKGSTTATTTAGGKGQQQTAPRREVGERRRGTNVLSQAGSKRASGRRRRRPSRLASFVYLETVIGWKSSPLATAERKTK